MTRSPASWSRHGGCGRQQHVDSGLLDRVERQFLPADRALNPVADLQREHRVMGDQHCAWTPPAYAESLANEFDLVFVDPAVLEGQRTRRVDPEHGHARELDERDTGSRR